MKLLVCNVGSTSLKYQLFDMDQAEQVLAWGGAERVGTEKSEFYWQRGDVADRGLLPMASHREAIEWMLTALIPHTIATLCEIDCVAFKVVHAKAVTGVQYLTDSVLDAMADFNAVAPAHNPPYLAAIAQFRSLMPKTPLIGAFETAFHKDMPPEAYLYSLPASLCREKAIRRYGFHGASLEYLSTFTAEKMGRSDLKLICCHLGGSGSICAVKNGVSVDTSLGMSLQCGVMHNNRIGDMDPYIIFYLMEQCGMTLAQVKELLQKQSGFFGMSGGVSGDLRDVEAAALAGNADAANAVSSYCYSIKKYIGSYMAAMGGLDAVVFGGGIGRRSASVRRRALENLECFGIHLDLQKNQDPQGGADISVGGSPVSIFVVDTNEEIIVARKANALLSLGKNPF